MTLFPRAMAIELVFSGGNGCLAGRGMGGRSFSASYWRYGLFMWGGATS